MNKSSIMEVTRYHNLTTEGFFNELYGDYTQEECEKILEEEFPDFLDLWMISRQGEEHRRDCWEHELKIREKNPDYYYAHMYFGTELEKKWWSEESDKRDFIKAFKKHLNHEYDDYEHFMGVLYEEYLEKCNRQSVQKPIPQGYTRVRLQSGKRGVPLD